MDHSILPRTFEEYKKAPSTKLDCLVQILRHHISRPGLNYFDVNTLGEKAKPFDPRTDVSETIGPVPPLDPNMPPEKIIIYFSWPFMRELITNVLAWNNISAAFLDGSKSPTQRTKLIDEFNARELHKGDDGQPSQVMFISSVGTTGINLPRATVIILFVSAYPLSQTGSAC